MNIRDVLKGINTGAVYVLDEAKQPTLLLKIPEDVHFEAHTPIEYGHFEWYDYDSEGVIIRTLIMVYEDLNHLSNPLIYFDTFFNPNNQADHELLEHMAVAHSLHCMAWWNDAHLTYLGQKHLRWEEKHRKSIRRLLELSRGTRTQWPEAKIRCMHENPVV